MNVKTRMRLARIACAVCLLVSVGCTYPGDSSAYKPEEKPSKEKIQQQIADIKARTNMPDGVKAMALKKLEKDLADAK